MAQIPTGRGDSPDPPALGDAGQVLDRLATELASQLLDLSVTIHRFGDLSARWGRLAGDVAPLSSHLSAQAARIGEDMQATQQHLQAMEVAAGAVAAMAGLLADAVSSARPSGAPAAPGEDL